MAITSQEINNHQLPIQEFLKLLWGDSQPNGYFSLWTKKYKTTREYHLIDEQDGLCREVEDLKHKQDDIYFTIGLKSQKTGPSNRGVSSSILAIPGFWKVCWIKIVCFNKIAEIANTYLHKGAKVCISGKLDQHKWVTEENQTRSTYRLIAKDITFIKTDGRGFETQDPQDDSTQNNGSMNEAPF